MNKVKTLVTQLTEYNEAYRAGNPIVSDTVYDALSAELQSIDPDHELLNHVEVESFGGDKVVHEVPMLSTDKCYTTDDVERYIQRILNAANDCGISHDDIRFSMTPKLDGMAGVRRANTLATRGDGETGNDITRAIGRGLVMMEGAIGELVVVQSYFDEHLADHFEHPRNFTVGAIVADTLTEEAQEAYNAGVLHFATYNTIPEQIFTVDELREDIEGKAKASRESVDYKVDGVVISVTDPDIRNHMGSTSHHWRWQMAFKTKGELAITTIDDITWQVGRGGRLTPVMELPGVLVSGATISRVTAHHARNVQNLQLGKGAAIEISRSGEVIPFLERCVTPAEETAIPDICPECGGALTWQSDFLCCTNEDCDGRVRESLFHFFNTLGNVDLFGRKSIRKLMEGGVRTIEGIYALEENDLIDIGFGDGQAANLMREMQRSLSEPVNDWRFLAAFGVPHLGRGDSKKLLAVFPIDKLSEVNLSNIQEIKGFGKVTSTSIVDTFSHRLPEIEFIRSLGFNLTPTPLTEDQVFTESPITGKGIVFTGKLAQKREEMQENARSLGANVQSAVNKKTDYLVCGEKVGQTKMDKATGLGVTLLTEDEYITLIGQQEEIK